MSEDTNVYRHSGVVSRIDGNAVVVSLDKNVHCDTCRAKAACGLSVSESKEIEIIDSGSTFSINEPVEVLLRKNLGHKAVFWAYVFPFLLMLTTLLTTSLFLPESTAGLLSLLVLIPYYGIVYALKDYFRSTFRISIERM